MISRRHFLAGTGAALLLAACSDDSGSSADDDPTTTTASSGGGSTTTSGGDTDVVLGEAFDRNFLLVAGIPQRAPFVLFNREGGLVKYADAPATLDFVPRLGDGAPLPAVTVTKRGEDVDRAYYPLATTFASAGTWTMTTTVDGVSLESTVQVNESLDLPQVGGPLPSAATPTTTDPAGTTGQICTRDPACPFHTVSLDAALGSGAPLAVLVSTPAYCQVGICGPVLDLLVAEAPKHPGLTVIHIEVYPNGAPPDNEPTKVVTDTFGMGYEPALFVVGADGLLTARLDNIYDGAELAEVLSAV